MKNIYLLAFLILLFPQNAAANSPATSVLSIKLQDTKKEAQAGSVKAMYALGEYFAQKQNIEKAEYWYRMAFSKANGRAGFGLLALHDKGLIKLDNPEAIRKISFAYISEDIDRGNPGAALFLGKAYLKADNLARNHKKAHKLLLKAEKLGSPDAAYMLGMNYVSGVYGNVNQYRAFRYFKKAADAGLVIAYRNVAIAYMGGFGVAKDEKTAEKYYKKAADTGNILAMIDYALLMKKKYSDSEKYLLWLNKADAKNNKDAAYYLGKYYKKLDKIKSRSYFKKAARLKHYMAAVELKHDTH